MEVTSSAAVAAVQAYAKINAQWQWIERSKHVNLNELFKRMTPEELEAYAENGSLPGWFTEWAQRRRTVTMPKTFKHRCIQARRRNNN